MASLFIFDDLNEREKERSKRVFRDRNHPLDYLNDREVIERYRLPRRYLNDLKKRPTSKGLPTEAKASLL